MHQDLANRNLLKAHRFVYYQTKFQNNQNICAKHLDAQKDFLTKFKFDVTEELDIPELNGPSFVASHSSCQMFGNGSGSGFFDVAKKHCITNPSYDLKKMFSLPILQASIFYDKHLKEHICRYERFQFPEVDSKLKDAPTEILDLVSTDNTHSKEWERVLVLANASGKVEKMDIRRSGNVSSVSDNRCCSYDCIWN